MTTRMNLNGTTYKALVVAIAESCAARPQAGIEFINIDGFRFNAYNAY